MWSLECLLRWICFIILAAAIKGRRNGAAQDESLAEQLRLAKELRYSRTGVMEDADRAFKMFEAVARRGKGTVEGGAALYEMGHYHLHGSGEMPQDLNEAVRLFEEAYQAGDYDGAHLMAFFAGTGYGGREINQAKAVEYETYAALGGHVLSSIALGYRYLYGLGTTKDCERALMWYKDAATVSIENEVKYATQPLTDADRLTDETIKASSKAEGASIRQHWEHKAWQGDLGALYEVAKIYDTGAFGTTPDLAKATEAYKEAAERGHAGAMTDLGLMYAQGQGVLQDYDQAVDLLTKAAELAESTAQNALAYMYKMGVAVDIDHYKAKELFAAAADAGQGEALYHLGEYALEEKDYPGALSFFRRSARAGYLLARFREGQMLEAGMDDWHTPRSCPGAVAAYKEVAESGYWLEDLRAARESLREGKAESALVTYAIMANEGYAIAQANAAYMLRKRMGYSYADADDQALAFLTRAVVQRDEAVMYELADLMLQTKKGPSLSSAIAFLEAAADAGDDRAIRRLASLYEHGGDGVPKDTARAERMYRSLISSYRLKDVADFVATQAELHLRVLKLMASGGMERWLTGVTGSSSSSGTGTGLEVVQGHRMGSELMVISEDKDGRCLGPEARMVDDCSKAGLWIVGGKDKKEKEKSIVRVAAADRMPRCLCVDDKDRVDVADCEAPDGGARWWGMDEDGSLKFFKGQECLVVEGDGSVRVQPCQSSDGRTALRARQFGSGGGFVLKSQRDGQCFLGESWGSCEEEGARWGASLDDDGQPLLLYWARAAYQGYAGGRRVCLRKTRRRRDAAALDGSGSEGVRASIPTVTARALASEEEWGLTMGLCGGKSAGGWSVREGRVEAEEGRWCVARAEDGTAVLARRAARCEAVQLLEAA